MQGRGLSMWGLYKGAPWCARKRGGNLFGRSSGKHQLRLHRVVRPNLSNQVACGAQRRWWHFAKRGRFTTSFVLRLLRDANLATSALQSTASIHLHGNPAHDAIWKPAGGTKYSSGTRTHIMSYSTMYIFLCTRQHTTYVDLHIDQAINVHKHEWISSSKWASRVDRISARGVSRDPKS